MLKGHPLLSKHIQQYRNISTRAIILASFPPHSLLFRPHSSCSYSIHSSIPTYPLSFSLPPSLLNPLSSSLSPPPSPSLPHSTEDATAVSPVSAVEVKRICCGAVQTARWLLENDGGWPLRNSCQRSEGE